MSAGACWIFYFQCCTYSKTRKSFILELTKWIWMLYSQTETTTPLQLKVNRFQSALVDVKPKMTETEMFSATKLSYTSLPWSFVGLEFTPKNSIRSPWFPWSQPLKDPVSWKRSYQSITTGSSYLRCFVSKLLPPAACKEEINLCKTSRKMLQILNSNWRREVAFKLYVGEGAQMMPMLVDWI